MAYNHGITIYEQETSIIAPIVGTAGLQVIFGTAPVNLASDPYAVTNKVILANSYKEAVSQLGFSYDFKNYTLCQSIDACFRVFNVAPIILVNVLDPTKHKKLNNEEEVTVTLMQATVEVTGILTDTVVVKDADAGDAQLTPDVDYVLGFDNDGYLVVTLLPDGAAATSGNLKVASESIDPTQVTKNDIIGGYDALTGTESGLELVRHVYPTFGYTPGLLLAPGWTHDPEVAAAMHAKCEGINGSFKCECIVDIDTNAVKVYTDLKTWKDQNGYTGLHEIALWPMAKVGSKKYYFSALYGALTAYTDATHEDVPYKVPSNEALPITGLCLDDDTEVVLDQLQANTMNGWGIVTAININGWKSWGDNTCIYPSSTDVKDRYINIRRFFSWWGNSFILTYFQKVDDPANIRLIQSICDSENIRGNAYVAKGMMAGCRIEFSEEENPVTELLNGHISFHQYIAPYTPAEWITNTLEFDPDMLTTALASA